VFFPQRPQHRHRLCPGYSRPAVPPPSSPQAPQDGSATGPAEDITCQAEDQKRLALSLNDVVLRRLFTAGLDLHEALRLMGDHPASGKICHAVDELDQAIRDLRDAFFDHLAE
jgi:hypothetical protein